MLGAALVVTGASAQQGADDLIVARVGSDTITRGELERRLARVPAIQLATFGSSADEIKRAFLEKVVVRDHLLSQGAASIADQPEQRLKQSEALRTALLAKLHQQADPRNIPDDEVARYYEANQAKFQTPERVRVWRILVATRDEAQALIADLKKSGGEARWKDVAREKSLDKASNERGGDLGFVGADGRSSEVSIQVNPALAVAALKVPAGEIVPEPVAEGERWAVIWNRGVQPALKRPLELEAGSIRQLLGRQKLEGAAKALTDKLRAELVRDVSYEGVQLVEIAASGEVSPRRRTDVVRHKAPGKPQPSSAPGGLR